MPKNTSKSAIMEKGRQGPLTEVPTTLNDVFSSFGIVQQLFSPLKAIFDPNSSPYYMWCIPLHLVYLPLFSNVYTVNGIHLQFLYYLMLTVTVYAIYEEKDIYLFTICGVYRYTYYICHCFQMCIPSTVYTYKSCNV